MRILQRLSEGVEVSTPKGWDTPDTLIQSALLTLFQHSEARFNASAHADYWFRQVDKAGGQLKSDLSHIPCVKPPFPIMWFEAAPTTTDFCSFGCLVVDSRYLDNLERVNGAAGALNLTFFHPTTEPGLIGCGYGSAAVVYDLVGRVVGGGPRSLGPENRTSDVASDVIVVLQALSAFHCRSKRVVEYQPPERLAKKRKNKGRPPLLSFRVVDLATDSVSVTARPKSEATTGTMPMHWAAGHYADYREGKGLFGKHNVLIWKGPHLKGSVEGGIVSKEYISQGWTSRDVDET